MKQAKPHGVGGLLAKGTGIHNRLSPRGWAESEAAMRQQRFRGIRMACASRIPARKLLEARS